MIMTDGFRQESAGHNFFTPGGVYTKCKGVYNIHCICAAQCAAKRRTAPERVSVRAQVRQDQNRVAVAQRRGKLPIIHTSSLISGVLVVQMLDHGADVRALLD